VTNVVRVTNVVPLGFYCLPVDTVTSVKTLTALHHQP
jgi:hypothetical protein